MSTTSPTQAGGATAVGRFEFVDLHPAAIDLRNEVLAGLSSTPKCLPPKLFYDERGSELFEAITRLPEYYPTRTEISILQEHASEIAQLFGEDFALIEFGSGASAKVRILLDAAAGEGTYMPIDMSCGFLQESARSIAEDYPQIQVLAVCADYTRLAELPEAAAAGRRIIFFPGSTIGNLEPDDAAQFLRSTARILSPGDAILIGVDLLKDEAILHAAYNDAQGVTAEFNLNLLARLNRELGADFDLAAFRHRALLNDGESRIEMHLVSLRRQTVHIAGRAIEFDEGETIHTENSYKYGYGRFRELASSSGLVPVHGWCDADKWFSLHWLEVGNRSPA